MSDTRSELLAGRFELEQLESRVLLSADILAASASLATAAHAASEHKIFATEQHSVSSLSATATEQMHYNPSDKVGGIFEGMTGEALTPAVHSEHHHEAATPKVHAPAPVENQSATTTQTTSAVRAEAKTSATRTVSSTAQPAAPTTISAATVTGSTGNVAAQQLTETLKAANAPPVNSPVSKANPQAGATDFVSFIQQILSGQSGSYTGSPPVPGSLSVGNFLQLNGVTLTFNATETLSLIHI